MSDTEIEFSSFSLVDLAKGVVAPATVDGGTPAVNDYINGIVPFVQRRRNNKAFRFRSATAEAAALISEIVCPGEGRGRNQPAEQLAQRLAYVEKRTDVRYGHLHEDRRMTSGLVQALFSRDDERAYLVAKVDSQAFLDPADYQRHDGLPFERYVLKSCMIPLRPGTALLDTLATIFDTNAHIAKYWWHDFLELDEVNTDAYNTEQSFQKLEGLLKRKLSRDCKTDYTFLRNRLVSYFRTHEAYVHDDMMQQVFEGYSPAGTNLDYSGLKALAQSLPDSVAFDRQFGIRQDLIKARIRHRIPLGNNMELSLLADVQDLGNVVTALKQDDRKYLMIHTDTGYDFFVRGDEDTRDSAQPT